MTNLEYWQKRHPVTDDDDGSGAYGDAWDEWAVLTAGDHALDNLSLAESEALFSKWCDEKRNTDQ